MKNIFLLLFSISSITFSQWNAINSGISSPFDQTTFSLIEHGANSSLLLQSYNAGAASPRLYRTTNNGDQWTLLPSTGIYNCYLEYNGRLFAGKNGGSGVVYSTDDGKTWINASGFPATVNILDIEVIGSTLFAANILGGVFVSTDNGNTWVSKNSNGARKLAKIGTTLFVGILGGVIKTTDLGVTWTTVNKGLTGVILQTDQLVSSGNALIAFTGGNIFRSTDQGDNWSLKTLPVSIVGTTDFFSLDAEGNNVIVLNTQTIIFSSDAGATWVNITKNFPAYTYFTWQNVKAQCAIVSGSYVICGTIPYSATIPGAGVYRSSFTGSTGIEENKFLQPTDFQLSQNFPNPFNPSTVIKYNLPKDGYVTLKIYDILGKEIVTLVNENKQAGYYNATFNASNLPSGIYIYSIQSNEYNQSKKMLLMK